MWKHILGGLAATVLVVVVVAGSVVSLWGAVTDAPWESEVADTTTDGRDEARCEAAFRLREAIISASTGPRGSVYLSPDAEEQTLKAEREIDRYC